MTKQRISAVGRVGIIDFVTYELRLTDGGTVYDVYMETPSEEPVLLVNATSRKSAIAAEEAFWRAYRIGLEEVTDAAYSYGSSDLYVGDDGKIYA